MNKMDDSANHQASMQDWIQRGLIGVQYHSPSMECSVRAELASKTTHPISEYVNEGELTRLFLCYVKDQDKCQMLPLAFRLKVNQIGQTLILHKPDLIRRNPFGFK